MMCLFADSECYLSIIPEYHCHHKHYRPGKKFSANFSCNLVPENCRYKFQVNQLVMHYRFLTGTWKRQNHRLPAEILWELILVIFDRLVTGEYSGGINLVMISVTMVLFQ